MKKRYLWGIIALLLVVSIILPMDVTAAAKLNKSTTSVRVGKTVKLKVKGTKKKVRWVSRNNKIATVSSSGVVKGKKAGVVNVIAKFGSNKLTCKVTVLNAPSLSKTNISLYPGKTEKIVVNNPTATIKWLSNNKKVATVNKGVVKAVSPGNTTITVKCGTYTRKCKVVVRKKPTLSKKSVIIQIGKTENLNVLNWGGAITWASSNPSIATVNGNGVVKAVGVGNTVITATCGKFNLRCKVIIKMPSISKTHLTLGKYREYKLVVNNYNNPKWTTSNGSVARVSDGSVTAVNPGIATITATAGPYKLSTIVKVIYLTPTASNYVALQKIYHKGYKKYGKYFFYSFPRSQPTYDKAMTEVRNKRKTGTTCVVPARWGLRDMGLSSSGFYAKSGKFQGYANKKAYWTLITSGGPIGLKFSKAVQKKKLKKGDILAFKGCTHTVIYSGDRYYVYEGGSIPLRLGYSKVGIKVDYRNYYSNKNISQVLRWKK